MKKNSLSCFLLDLKFITLNLPFRLSFSHSPSYSAFSKLSKSLPYKKSSKKLKKKKKPKPSFNPFDKFPE